MYSPRHFVVDTRISWAAKGFDMSGIRLGTQLLDYAMDNAVVPSQLDSAGHVPRSPVAAASQAVAAGPGHALADTILYLVHVRGFTARHLGVPPDLRGTYAGLAHDAALQHLVDLRCSVGAWASQRPVASVTASRMRRPPSVVPPTAHPVSRNRARRLHAQHR